MSDHGTVGAITHVGLHVGNLERSLQFYRGLLGFELIAQWEPSDPYVATLVGYPQPDIHAALLRPPGSEVLLELVELRGVRKAPADPSEAPPGTAHVGFTVTGLDELYARVKAQGVLSISDPVTPTSGPNKGGSAVNLLDPDGIRVELVQSSRRIDDYDPAAEERLSSP